MNHYAQTAYRRHTEIKKGNPYTSL